MVLLIDNYYSFTWNLADLVRRSHELIVIRNDELSIEEMTKLQPEGLLISPGPGRPSNSGISEKAITHWSDKIPVLGICLGHQLLGSMFGAKVIYADEPVHGKTSDIEHNGQGIFERDSNTHLCYEVPFPDFGGRKHLKKF